MTSRRAYPSPLPPTAAVPAATPSPPTTGRRPTSFVATTWQPGALTLADRGRTAPLVVSTADHPGVLRVTADLRDDIERVTGTAPAVHHRDRLPDPAEGAPVLIGTIGRSPLIDRLIATGRLDVRGIEGRWETSLQQIVTDPAPGVPRALVITGSDQRGTIYGVYELSRQLGVSPWYWWNDIPARRRPRVHVLPGRHTQGTPAVKYRGFSLDNGHPGLGIWAPAHFGPGHAPGHPGGFTSAFYARVFELMLRLKANCLWPAARGRAFAEDDAANHATATAYGVVLGTSPESPMMRAAEEWHRHAGDGTDPYGGNGAWSFHRNGPAVRRHWADGIRRMTEQHIEGIVTLGMRGDEDTGLPDGERIRLMEAIIAAQRDILRAAGTLGTPQVHILGDGAQRSWERGLRPPDDVTVVLCDDTRGNLRTLPDPDLPERPGGYGLYHHLGHTGAAGTTTGADTTSLAAAWEQLHLAHRYGIGRLWIADGGGLKGRELPLQFFLDYAWDPGGLPLERLGEWERAYAATHFGPRHAPGIAEVLHTYGLLQSRREPEPPTRRTTRDPDTGEARCDDAAIPYSLENYRELERVTDAWEQLDDRAERIAHTLPADLRDAYYQLVQYQVEATANLYALRAAQFTNLRYAREGRAATNTLADTAEARCADDLAMTDYWNTTLAGGTWRGFRTRPETGHGDPDAAGPDALHPPVRRIELPERAALGVAVDGSTAWWPGTREPLTLPELSPYRADPAPYLEVFNRGRAPLSWTITSSEPWLAPSQHAGLTGDQLRITVTADWSRAPRGRSTAVLTVRGPDGAAARVVVPVHHPRVRRRELRGFIEADGYVSIEAGHWTRSVGAFGVRWRRLPDAGRTGAAMTPFPVTAPRFAPGTGPCLEYDLTLFTAGRVRLLTYLSPRNDVLPTGGPEFAVSFDDQPPQRVHITGTTGADATAMNGAWEQQTSDNVIVITTHHDLPVPGRHTLKVWMVDPTVIVQKLVTDTGGLRPSYLGPPESLRLR
ncbi:glycosyl hydrolase 115 family protein [Streptomyces sp. AA0539]|uniref:glycosyl hydrolase 115 family protein n=1 Tax=Streptomyces sp. AA0539 TaxID=1210045 RepID=UPI0002EE7C56|nr:glycosyl hydrolase 115 family protein [Streptomyces sp. AA0539]